MRCLIVDSETLESFEPLMAVARGAGHEVRACAPAQVGNDELSTANVLVVRWRGTEPSVPTDTLKRVMESNDPAPPLHVATVEVGDDDAVNAAMNVGATIILTLDDLKDPWTLSVRCRQLYAAELAAHRAGEIRLDRLAANLPGAIFRAVFEKDRSARFEYISEGIRNILGMSAREAISQPGLTLSRFHPEEMASFWSSMQESVKTMSTWNWEGRVFDSAGKIHWCKGVARPELRPGGAYAFEGMFYDNTESREAQAETDRARARFQTILEAIPDAVVYRDLPGGELIVNRAFRRLFRYGSAELKFEEGDLVDKITLERLTHSSDPLMVGAEPKQKGHSQPVNVLCRRKDGKTFPGELHGAFVNAEDESEIGFVTIVRDTTERKDMDRKLAEVSHYEQQRIGHELHDGIGQQLTGVAFLAKSLSEQVSAVRPEAAETADRIREVVEDSIHKVRNHSAMLAPLLEVHDSLVEGLSQMSSNISETYGVACRFIAGTDVGVGPAAAKHLYRIAQEAISNALRHGGASSLIVSVAQDQNMLVLSVRDNGTGMNELPQPREGGGMGMRIMLSRASSIGATLDVDSVPGEGSTITVTYPLPRSRHETAATSLDTPRV